MIGLIPLPSTCPVLFIYFHNNFIKLNIGRLGTISQCLWIFVNGCPLFSQNRIEHLIDPWSNKHSRKRLFQSFSLFGSDSLTTVSHRVVNGRILVYQIVWRSLSAVYGTAKYGRNNVAIERQLTDIYDHKRYKKTVYIIVYSRDVHGGAVTVVFFK